MAHHVALGLRRRVAEQNLALAFPERGSEERAAILAAHYHELGRVLVEYARLSDLVHAPAGQVVDSVVGMEHLDAARSLGRTWDNSASAPGAQLRRFTFPPLKNALGPFRRTKRR